MDTSESWRISLQMNSYLYGYRVNYYAVCHGSSALFPPSGVRKINDKVALGALSIKKLSRLGVVLSTR